MMAENDQSVVVDGASAAGVVPPRRQSARIQNKKQQRAEKEKEHPNEEEEEKKNVRVRVRGRGRGRGRAKTRKESNNATAMEIVEADGTGVTPKKLEERTNYVARKELLARRRFELLDADADGSALIKRRKENNNNNNAESVNEAVTEEQNAAAAYAVDKKDNVADDANTTGEVHDNVQVENGLFSLNDDDAAEKSAYANVKNILRVFNKYYLEFVEEEEKRCRKEIVENKSPTHPGEHKKGNTTEGDRKNSKKAGLKRKSKKEYGNENGTKAQAKRPDLKAARKMIKGMGDPQQMENSGPILDLKKRIGHIPGIRVGHQFFSRAEMVVLGFHSQWMSGIDYIGKGCIEEEYKNLKFPLAIAIVLSGMYEDDVDNAEDIVYTGQGGHDLTGNKHQIRHQKLDRGNLALKNCMVNDLPVRVVRGHKDQNSYTGKVYTYDGLYKVIDYWSAKGISGFTVYKFKLRRVVGQPMLTTNQVQFAYGRSKSISDLPGLVCEDITDGFENFRIPAINLVDDPPVPPPSGFTYSTTIQVAKNVVSPATAPGCSCKGGSCMDPMSCACAKLNGGDFPYIARGGGRLIQAKDVVYECGPNCGCGPECLNRVSQRGLRHHLEVFRAPRKGWGVRSSDLIPMGAPVCEYTGILRKSEDVENEFENNYIFDIDCLQTMRGLGGRNKRSGDLLNSQSEAADQTEDQKYEAEYCIDAGSVGNIARFINHSCEPNLFVQCVLSSHHDMKLARIVLFAAENIPRRQELTYDYGYALDSVLGPDGKVKKMPCYCGATGCRKRLF